MGRGTAALLAERGARVAIVDPAAAGLAETEGTLKAAGHDVIAEPISVTDGEAVARLVAQVRTEWGGVEGLVHCGAILRYAGTLEADLETWREVIDVNLTGTFVIGQAVARAMIADERKGAIVNIASVAAVMGLPNLSAYSASKGGGGGALPFDGDRVAPARNPRELHLPRIRRERNDRGHLGGGRRPRAEEPADSHRRDLQSARHRRGLRLSPERRHSRLHRGQRLDGGFGGGGGGGSAR